MQQITVETKLTFFKNALISEVSAGGVSTYPAATPTPILV
jgi:hypothetical protein